MRDLPCHRCGTLDLPLTYQTMDRRGRLLTHERCSCGSYQRGHTVRCPTCRDYFRWLSAAERLRGVSPCGCPPPIPEPTEEVS